MDLLGNRNQRFICGIALYRLPFNYGAIRRYLRTYFGANESPFAQPRNVIGGYLVATIIAVILGQLFGDGWWVMAIGVATTIAAMQFTKTLHPPAGAATMVVLSGHASWGFIFVPVLVGAIILVLCGVITNNFAKNRHYPKYWW